MKNTFGLDDKVIPIYFPSSLVRWLESQGYKREELIEGTDLEATEIDKPEALTSFRKHRKIIENAVRLADSPHLGLAFGQQLQITSMGIVGYAALSEKNVGQSLQTIVKFIRLQASLLDLELARKEDYVSLLIDETIDLGSIRRFIFETILAFSCNMLESQGIEKLPGMRCKMRMTKTDDWDDYKHLLPFPVQFDQSVNALEIPAEYMDLPLKMADPVSASNAIKICEEQLQRFENQEGLLNRLQALIEDSLDNPPSLAKAADHFCVSPRTLRRELEKLDTTYQTQLDHYRKEAAINYLKGSTLSVQEIADKMGYNDSSNFARAFRKWTGKSPGDYRQ
ncbi:ornithine utilization transcriptional regulator OruR [Maricurvus nonylphenolicus]|uniref:AraC family transcriptional regulator n=1 Tax=Maricurvus nonylphenolicus TaxID=1008307 RepID=UPI0036F28B3B